jgi:murein DD-endopeptidase MepM/ murein hydrolase activator NlpD
MLTVLAGPTVADGLTWLQVASQAGVEPPLRGWVATADPSGIQLVMHTAAVAALQIARPCDRQWPLTQGWGTWPEFYARFHYDGVPLKGHNGLDFGTPVDTPILACADGTVLRVDFEPGGFGNFMLVRHAWGESLYAHLNRVDVAVGSTVTSGQQIALSGNTGAGTGAHLHFGIRINPYRRADGWGGFCDPTPLMAPGDLGRSRSLQRPVPLAPELPGRARP